MFECLIEQSKANEIYYFHHPTLRCERRRVCCSLSGWEDFVDVFRGNDLSASLLAVLEELDLELKSELALGVGEGGQSHSGVRVKDAVEGEAGSLNGVIVHLC